MVRQCAEVLGRLVAKANLSTPGGLVKGISVQERKLTHTAWEAASGLVVRKSYKYHLYLPGLYPLDPDFGVNATAATSAHVFSCGRLPVVDSLLLNFVAMCPNAREE